MAHMKLAILPRFYGGLSMVENLDVTTLSEKAAEATLCVEERADAQ